MAQRGNRPKDPADANGGVRGTHGLGDAPRDTKKIARVRAAIAETRDAQPDEASGEEHDFEVANAMAELESMDDRAARREHDAAVARGDDDDPLRADLAADTDEEERKERGLETVKTPGPGPRDTDAGRARTKHLEDAGLARSRH